MVCKRNSFRTDECVELWIVGESIFLRWIGELNCGDISGNAQKLQPSVNSASLISAIQSKLAHWDTKIDLPFQMPQDQDAFLLIGRIYINACYRRRESSVEEALIEMYLAGVSMRRVEDITEALWGSKVSPATISELNKKAYVHIEDWRNRPLQGGRYPYVYVDGIYLRRNWGGEYENVAILVAIAVNEDGYREVLGAAEGMKEDKASWVSFFQWLRGRGLDGVKLIVGDKCLGMLEAVGEVFPDAKYQRCTVHFYRNVFSVVPRSKVKLVAKMLKAIHAQESKKAAREKAKAVVAQLREMKLKEAAKKVEDSVEETLTYCDFPYEHWTRIRTNNVIERLNREIRRRTRVVGTFPDGNSALMLVCARLRHVAGTQWGNKKYMNMKHLEAALEDASIAG